MCVCTHAFAHICVEKWREGKKEREKKYIEVIPIHPSLLIFIFARNDSWSQQSTLKMLNYYMVIKFLKLFKNTQNRKN